MWEFEPYQTMSTVQGRAGVTGIQAVRCVFKVPVLRNVALTYPYFHDGGAETLAEAVDIMGRLQLGKQFNDQEKAQIVAFLKSFTGEQPAFPMPMLPPSTAKTPQPKPFEQSIHIPGVPLGAGEPGLPRLLQQGFQPCRWPGDIDVHPRRAREGRL